MTVHATYQTENDNRVVKENLVQFFITAVCWNILLVLFAVVFSSFKLETSQEVSTKFMGSSLRFSFECDLWLPQSLPSSFLRPELGISRGISKSRGLNGGVKDPRRLKGGSSASSKSIDLRKWGWCIASLIKALNCKDSNMPLLPPFLAKWSDNCFKCDANRLFSANFWGGEWAKLAPEEGVGGGGWGGEEELKEALKGLPFGGEVERACGGNGPPMGAWVYEGTVPSLKTTARMTWRTCSSGQLPRRIRCGRPRPFGLNSAVIKQIIINIDMYCFYYFKYQTLHPRFPSAW